MRRGFAKKRLIDALNHVNFRRDSIIINLEHVRYGSSLSLRAYPQPCTDQGLQCLWVEAPPSNLSMSYVFRSFMVDRGLDLLVAEAEATEMNDEGISLTLPEHCSALQPRRAKRYRCHRGARDPHAGRCHICGRPGGFASPLVSGSRVGSATPDLRVDGLGSAPICRPFRREGGALFGGMQDNQAN